jgi:hypothetical protein
MTVEQKYLELIHADIDGELSEKQRVALCAFLESSEEGRELHAELSSLCQAISASAALDPPPHLRHVILESIKPRRKRLTVADQVKALFSSPALRYAGTFAAGVLLTLSFVGSDQASKHAFDDLTELVGTISKDIPRSVVAGRSMHLDAGEIAGTVTLGRAGHVMVLDFDLASHKPIKIVADFPARDIWFNGFAQLEHPGTTVSAESGRVILHSEGRQRYAIYLNNVYGKDARINLKFYLEDALIHEGELRFTEQN